MAKHQISMLNDYPYSNTTHTPQSISCTDRGQDLKRELVYHGVVSVQCPTTCMPNLVANISSPLPKAEVFGNACAFSVYSSVCLSAFYTGILKANHPIQPGGGIVSFRYEGFLIAIILAMITIILACPSDMRGCTERLSREVDRTASLHSHGYTQISASQS